MGCSCSSDVRGRLDGSGRDRRIGWTTELDPGLSRWYRYHAVFTRKRSGVSRLGLALIVCACEPGYTRVGGSTVVIYGPPDSLMASYEAAPDPVVLALLYEGAIPAALVDRAARDRRPLVWRRMDDAGGVLVEPLKRLRVSDLIL